MSDLTSTCAECGATFPSHETCQTKFHELLALEALVPGAPGDLPHFFAVASYGVQHPQSMGYTVRAVDGLRTELTRALTDGTTADNVRKRVRHELRAKPRVRRQSGDPIPRWPIRSWPVNLTHVLRGGADNYTANVKRWARSVVETIQGLNVECEDDTM